MTQRIIVTRGLPGAGKTTWARAQARKPDIVRISRDALRRMYFDKVVNLSRAQEQVVSHAEEALAAAALHAGNSVIIDAMHLRPRYIRRWMKFAETYAVPCVVEEFPVSLADAISLDALRDNPVGEYRIRELAAKYYRNDTFLPISALDQTPSVRRYHGTPGKPRAILCDLDGTIALMQGRSPFAWKRVGEDKLNVPVAAALRALAAQCDVVIYVSGRDGSCERQTRLWLQAQNLPSGQLLMRAKGDVRKDATVKQELFDVHIRDNYDVWLVLDDRNQVVRMWRDLGLTCLQVADGNF